jgi:hypothetical protein
LIYSIKFDCWEIGIFFNIPGGKKYYLQPVLSPVKIS